MHAAGRRTGRFVLQAQSAADRSDTRRVSDTALAEPQERPTLLTLCDSRAGRLLGTIRSPGRGRNCRLIRMWLARVIRMNCRRSRAAPPLLIRNTAPADPRPPDLGQPAPGASPAPGAPGPPPGPDGPRLRGEHA